MADENRIQDPFSLIPEEEKEDLVQDILGLDQSTGLIKEDDESFFDTMLDTPGSVLDLYQLNKHINQH